MSNENEESKPARDQQPRSGFSRRKFLKYSGTTAAAGGALAAMSGVSFGAPNAITTENALPGNDADEWGSYDRDSIQGFTTKYSYLPGDTVQFKVNTPSKNYRIRVYRMGWYGGKGARRLADVTPSVTLPQVQPTTPKTQPATGLVDCGNWAVSASWAIPANAVSGVYYALLERLDNDESNHIIFVVKRNGGSDVLVQTSDVTWQAYNRWGGNSLYYGNPAGRAYKVSYNRPMVYGEIENSFLATEVPLIRFLERNGYDVSYCGGVDVHQSSSLLSSRKVFISQGHDEYVSGPQRANVTTARDAGVNLIFMTGNEYFWKVRFEPSIDGANTTDRTLVCYKETLDSAKIDPTAAWTGTWRDPRFSPPADGGRPENALTGQLFRVILPTGQADDTITVPAEYSPLRFWRNSAVANLTPGQTKSLAPSSLGYEFDCDEDNGFRPPGSVRLSSTTVSVPQILQDYGKTYVSGTITHNMTMYRAPSGALVWGTGTVQWCYGLDSYHVTDVGTATDPSMQQATVNMLADMGVQPSSLMSGLISASKSTDTLPPVVAINAPVNGSTIPVGTAVTVSGTATDAGGGIVAAIEVSLDNGATWHMATGRASWSYVFTLLQTGAVPVKVRAIDDSCNIGAASTVSVTGGPRSAPCSIWPSSILPGTPAADDASKVEVGVRFRAKADGFVTALRFYKGTGNSGTHVGHLWTNAGAPLATVTFANETATGWQQASITAVPIKANTTYVASVYMPVGHYAADAGYFNQAFDLAPLRALANGEDGANGVYTSGAAGFPNQTFGATNYWVDIVYGTDNNAPPTVADTDPAANLQSVAIGASIRFTFSEPMTANSITTELRDPSNAVVPGSLTYDAPSFSTTFKPTNPLNGLTAYTATVTAAKDADGNAMVAPFVLKFTTIGAAGTSPLSLWDTSAVPATMVTTDTSAVELGMRFTSDVAGTITAIRYFKAAGSSGTHVGHVWNAAGSVLATATFSAESAAGWQQAPLSTPLSIQANTVYTVSYYAPSGVYAVTSGGLTAAVNRAPLQSLASDNGGNGVYRYGASNAPSTSGGGSNYWADVVFAAAADTSAPGVTTYSPGSDLVSVATGTNLTATFSKAINPSTLAFTLTLVGGAAVAATVTYDASSKTVSLAPGSALTKAKQYAVSLAATDTNGNAMAAPFTWKFTTVVAAGGSPITLWDTSAVPASPSANDATAIEVGVRVQPTANGAISGVRFYKGPGNTGAHVGHVWNATGSQVLGTVAFAAETATGWQQAMFSTPVPVTAGTQYVVSCFAPNGNYAVTPNGFAGAVANGPLVAPAGQNGVYRYGSGGFPNSSYGASNYWVDAIFIDNSGPSVVAQVPVSGATTADAAEPVSATFDEDIQPTSLVMKLRDSGGAVVAGSASYDSASLTATFTPSGPLSAGATYTASVEAAKDLGGNPMAAASSWSFTTTGATVVSIWPNTTTPGTLVTNDGGPLELGMKFRVTVAGSVQGVRFYKGGPTNSGPHVGSLWAPDGTNLGSVNFTSESARGWQSATFPTPVPVTPGITYTVSYFAPSGRYSSDAAYFASQATTNGPIEALQNGTDGSNGLYKYTGTSARPTDSYNSSNYWVDVLFAPGS